MQNKKEKALRLKKDSQKKLKMKVNIKTKTKTIPFTEKKAKILLKQKPLLREKNSR